MLSLVDKNGNKLPIFDHTNTLERFLSRYQVSVPHSKQTNKSSHGYLDLFTRRVQSSSEVRGHRGSSRDQQNFQEKHTKRQRERTPRKCEPRQVSADKGCSCAYAEQAIESRKTVKERSRCKSSAQLKSRSELCAQGSHISSKRAEESNRSRRGDGCASDSKSSNDRIATRKMRDEQTIRFTRSMDNANVRHKQLYHEQEYRRGPSLENKRRNEVSDERKHIRRSRSYRNDHDRTRGKESRSTKLKAEEILCCNPTDNFSGQCYEDVPKSGPTGDQDLGIQTVRDSGCSKTRNQTHKQSGRQIASGDKIRTSNSRQRRQSTSEARCRGRSENHGKYRRRKNSEEMKGEESSSNEAIFTLNPCTTKQTRNNLYIRERTDKFKYENDASNITQGNQKQPSGHIEVNRRNQRQCNQTVYDKFAKTDRGQEMADCTQQLSMSKDQPLLRSRSKECRRRDRDLHHKERIELRGRSLEPREVSCRDTRTGRSESPSPTEEPHLFRDKRFGHKTGPKETSRNKYCISVTNETSTAEENNNDDYQRTKLNRGTTSSGTTSSVATISGGKCRCSSRNWDVDHRRSPDGKAVSKNDLDYIKNALHDVCENESNFLSEDDETIIVYIPPKRGKDGRRKPETLHFCDDGIIYKYDLDVTKTTEKNIVVNNRYL